VAWGTPGPGVRAQGAVDAWKDVALLAALRGQGYPSGCDRAERDRASTPGSAVPVAGGAPAEAAGGWDHADGPSGGRAGAADKGCTRHDRSLWGAEDAVASATTLLVGGLV
jgi:hypothetical protein